MGSDIYFHHLIILLYAALSETKTKNSKEDNLLFVKEMK